MLEDGLMNFFKTLSTSSSDLYSILSNPQASSSSAPPEPLENPPYGMSKGFTPSQAPPVMSALPSRPKTGMVMSPPIIDPLNIITSSTTTSRNNELASFVPPYQTVTHSIPPIPPMGMGIPHGPVLDYYFNKYGALDMIRRFETRRGHINSFEECLAAVREDFKKQMWETFRVELSNKSHVYQKLYHSYFDSVSYPTGWRTSYFVKFNGEDNRTT
jgi:hypothetical protein